MLFLIIRASALGLCCIGDEARRFLGAQLCMAADGLSKGSEGLLGSC